MGQAERGRTGRAAQLNLLTSRPLYSRGQASCRSCGPSPVVRRMPFPPYRRLQRLQCHFCLIAHFQQILRNTKPYSFHRLCLIRRSTRGFKLRIGALLSPISCRYERQPAIRFLAVKPKSKRKHMIKRLIAEGASLALALGGVALAAAPAQALTGRILRRRRRLELVHRQPGPLPGRPTRGRRRPLRGDPHRHHQGAHRLHG
jgi:hypothetical protein